MSVLTGFSAGSDLGYDDYYCRHEPLAVVGYPSRETLKITQRVVWRIADGRTGEPAALGTDGEPRKTAENWIVAFGEGAREPTPAPGRMRGGVPAVSHGDDAPRLGPERAEILGRHPHRSEAMIRLANE
ncbi:hypothetical protein [Streptomyces sp. NPDC059949]|uniref:hypothetical protein n=1 Tax=Streptomyces sp. NPDC059949 TaxID=3347013 RepID=UPI003655BAF0